MVRKIANKNGLRGRRLEGEGHCPDNYGVSKNKEKREPGCCLRRCAISGVGEPMLTNATGSISTSAIGGIQTSRKPALENSRKVQKGRGD